MSELTIPVKPGMRFHPYPEYRDSGVEWLGEVPASWRALRLKHLIRFNPSKSEIRGLPLEMLATFLPMESISEDGKIDCSIERALRDVIGGYTYFRNGDVLVAKITPCFENGKGALAQGLKNGIGFGTTELHILRPENINGRYLYYLTISHYFRNAGAAQMYGAGGQKRVPESFVEDLIVETPSSIEQELIADFLDRETARIDTLIEKKKKLIGLLEEKRTALITRAVTKGLDPNAPMKDSGVEWLGQIPAHWEICRVKFLKKGVRNALVDGPFGSNLKSVHFVANGDVYVIESNFATTGHLDKDKLKKITYQHFETIRRSEVRPGDIVIAKIGARYGRSSILPEIDQPAVVSGNSMKLSVDHEKVVVRFVHLGLTVAKLKGAFAVDVGTTAQPALSLGIIANLPLPLRPKPEQTRIVHQLDRRTTAIQRAIKRIRSGIKRLQEYRTALISAAVTGKIDVREIPSHQEAAS